jgi:uncharacterized metal-binding protein
MPVTETVLSTARRVYNEHADIRTLARESARTGACGANHWSRLQEIIDFAHRCEVHKIGIAHCVALMDEAKLTHQILEHHGFEVFSVCCKVGHLHKCELGLTAAEQIRPGEHETACNPVAQALLLEQAGCTLNVLLGLCVGHDSIFFLHTKVPTTVLVVKDHAFHHNPVAALYAHQKHSQENTA